MEFKSLEIHIINLWFILKNKKGLYPRFWKATDMQESAQVLAEERLVTKFFGFSLARRLQELLKMKVPWSLPALLGILLGLGWAPGACIFNQQLWMILRAGGLWAALRLQGLKELLQIVTWLLEVSGSKIQLLRLNKDNNEETTGLWAGLRNVVST